MSDTKAVLEAALDVVESRDFTYFLYGGVVASLWGEPRFTQDVDLVLFLPESETYRFLRRRGPPPQRTLWCTSSSRHEAETWKTSDRSCSGGRTSTWPIFAGGRSGGKKKARKEYSPSSNRCSEARDPLPMSLPHALEPLFEEPVEPPEDHPWLGSSGGGAIVTSVPSSCSTRAIATSLSVGSRRIKRTP